MEKEINKTLMRKLTNLIQSQDSGSAIIDLLTPLSDYQRKVIAKSRFASKEKQTVFFRICCSQSLEVVEYFLRKCSPNVDEKCKLLIGDVNETNVFASPFWSAAHRNNIDLAKLLLKYGADINFKTNRKSTPLRIACRENHVAMVKFLMANGADITTRNVDGTTCLMAGTGNSELIKYLIENGADINAEETGNWRATALHYAVYTDNIDAVRVLVEASADMSIKDKSGHEAYVCAALNTNTEVMEYLLRMNKEPINNVIKGYELLGAAFLAETNDEALGIKHLLTACNMKLEKEAYKFGTEFDILKQFLYLQELGDDEESLTNLPADEKTRLAVSILVCSRHLRIDSDFFLYLIMKYANILRNEGNVKVSYEIYRHVYDSITRNEEWFHENVALAVNHCILLLDKMLSSDLEFYEKQNKVECLLKMVCNHVLGASNKEFVVDDKPKKDTYRTIIFGFLYIVKMFLTLTPNKKRNSCIYDVVRINPKTEYGDTLLHLLVDRDAFSDNNPIRLSSSDPFLNVDVISFLLNHGIPTDNRNDAGSTPLYSLMYDFLDYDDDDSSEIIHLLLANGAHLDIPDNYGGDPLNYCYRYNIPAVRYQSLKCLAARVVVKEHINYNDHLPLELVSFIKLHTPTNEELL